MRTIPKPLAWGVPAVVATAVVAGLAVVPVVAGASPSLPERSAAQLLGDVTAAKDVPFSGRVVQTSRLGLPSVPGLDAMLDKAGASAGSQGGDALALLTGSHNGQIWYAGEDKVRVSATVGSSDSDLIRNGRDVWLWQSSDRTAQHGTLPAEPAAAGSASPVPSSPALTPQELTDEVLARVAPTTDVSVDGTAKVAGRSAYELVLRPKGEGSLVREVRLALDSKTSVPLRARVYSTKSAEPALEVVYSSISFEKPADSVFRFTPPAGATVSELGASDASAREAAADAQKQAGAAADSLRSGRAGVKVSGTAWTTVVELPAGSGADLGLPASGGSSSPAPSTGGAGSFSLDGLSLGTAVSGSWGSGRLIETNLVSVLVLEDGRVLAGAVTPEVLEKSAS